VPNSTGPAARAEREAGDAECVVPRFPAPLVPPAGPGGDGPSPNDRLKPGIHLQGFPAECFRPIAGRVLSACVGRDRPL